MISNAIDGVPYESWKGRFNGSVELEQEEAEAASMGETGVAVIVYNVTDVGSKLDKKTGVLARVPVFTVTEARVLDPELKQLLVERLGLYGGDTAEPVLITPKRAENVVVQSTLASDENVVPLSTVSDSFTFLNADVSTGEIISEFHPAAPFGDDTQLSFNDSEMDEVEVVGHINGFPADVTPPTQPAFESYVEDDREILGQIKVNPELAEFFSEAA